MKPMEILFDNDGQTRLGIGRQEMERRLREAMPDVQLRLYDLTGDGSHYQLEVKSSHFVGKTPIEQHRMVYAVFGDVMGNALHALALKTSPL